MSNASAKAYELQKQGLTYPEIAKLMGRSRSAVAGLIYRERMIRAGFVYDRWGTKRGQMQWFHPDADRPQTPRPRKRKVTLPLVKALCPC
jgi:hypothetical protein